MAGLLSLQKFRHYFIEIRELQNQEEAVLSLGCDKVIDCFGVLLWQVILVKIGAYFVKQLGHLLVSFLLLLFVYAVFWLWLLSELFDYLIYCYFPSWVWFKISVNYRNLYLIWRIILRFIHKFKDLLLFKYFIFFVYPRYFLILFELFCLLCQVFID